MALVATDLLTTCRLGGSALDGAFVTSVLATAPSHLDARDESNWTPTMWTVRNGATEALGTPTAVKTIAAVFRNEERSLAFGIMNAANTLGAVVTPLIIPLLALKVGWANSFLITGGLGLVWVAVWLLVSPGGAHEPAPAATETPASARRWVR